MSDRTKEIEARISKINEVVRVSESFIRTHPSSSNEEKAFMQRKITDMYQEKMTLGFEKLAIKMDEILEEMRGSNERP
jgi:hypothetical protein